MVHELILKRDIKPRLFNEEMVIGALVGVASFFIPGMPFIAGVLAIPALGAVGGLVGKSRLHREAVQGKRVVDELSVFNKDMLLGGLAGAVAVPTLSVGIELVGGAGLGAALATAIPTGGASLAGFAIAAIAATIVGAVVGGKTGQTRMVRAHREACHQKIVDNVSHSISPEIGHAVEYALEHRPKWAKGVLDDRLLAASEPHNPGRG